MKRTWLHIYDAAKERVFLLSFQTRVHLFLRYHTKLDSSSFSRTNPSGPLKPTANTSTRPEVTILGCAVEWRGRLTIKGQPTFSAAEHPTHLEVAPPSASVPSPGSSAWACRQNHTAQGLLSLASAMGFLFPRLARAVACQCCDPFYS